MPRHNGSTRRKEHRRKHASHRMHRRPRLARIKARAGRLKTPTAWGRWAV